MSVEPSSSCVISRFFLSLHSAGAFHGLIHFERKLGGRVKLLEATYVKQYNLCDDPRIVGYEVAVSKRILGRGEWS